MGNPYPPIESRDTLPDRMPDALLALADRLNRLKQSGALAAVPPSHASPRLDAASISGHTFVTSSNSGTYSAKNFRNSEQEQTKQGAPSDYISTLIMEKNEAFSVEVVSKYAQYRDPFKTLGEDSYAARRIAQDERNLLSAYNLFKAVKQAEAEIGKGNAFLKDTRIKSPLAMRTEYTTGGEFVYLRAYLIFEQKTIDYAPQFEPLRDGSFALTFVNSGSVRETYKNREILAAIKAAYSL